MFVEVIPDAFDISINYCRRLQGNSFEGPIPSSFSNLTSMADLRISELSNGSSSLSFVKNMKSLKTLVVSHYLAKVVVQWAASIASVVASNVAQPGLASKTGPESARKARPGSTRKGGLGKGKYGRVGLKQDGWSSLSHDFGHNGQAGLATISGQDRASMVGLDPACVASMNLARIPWPSRSPAFLPRAVENSESTGRAWALLLLKKQISRSWFTE
ncbi:putative LRR receptor-like serine/threonine-protein kinase [Nymphaea thermarum]|nr:putative LRR receptor-like serine/threonine-protein kinase [Nymphaea thermarum]